MNKWQRFKKAKTIPFCRYIYDHIYVYIMNKIEAVHKNGEYQYPYIHICISVGISRTRFVVATFHGKQKLAFHRNSPILNQTVLIKISRNSFPETNKNDVWNAELPSAA